MSSTALEHPSVRKPSGKKRKTVIWIVAVLLLVGAAGGWIYWTQSTYHLETVQAGVLYRCGLQSFREFETAVARVKPKTIVSLIDDRELADPDKPQFKREIDTFHTGGIHVVRDPVPLGGWPDKDQIDQFLAVVQDPAQQPVLVHCAQGVRRTGMMIAAYQMSVLGYDKAKAKASVLTFGHSERTANDVNRFIDAYDPQTRRMATTLPSSQE
jgi:protein-tyrosine phosphatase